MKIGRESILAWRLESQRLGSRRAAGPAEAIAWLGGVQAQDYRWAHWSAGLRTRACDEACVAQAMREGQIVRTWLMRGTLHFVAANDLPWLRALLAPGIIHGNARRYRQLELEDIAFRKSQQVIRQALDAQGPLTRPELKVHLERAGVPAAGQRMPYLLQRAALDGLITQGMPDGSEPTYVLLPEGMRVASAIEREQALGRLAGRYFASHGPATQQDFAWWAGLPAKDARLALDSAAGIASFEFDGLRYWASGAPPEGRKDEAATFLPPFDEYLLGYKERSLALDPAFMKAVNAGGGMPKPTVMVQGEIVATWSYKRQKAALAVQVQPFGELSSQAGAAIEAASGELGEFLGVPVEVAFPEM